TPCPSHEPTVVPTSPMHTLSYAASSDPSRRSETLTCDVAVTGSTPSPETVTVTGYTPGAAHVCAACTAYPPNAPATSVPATGSDPSPNVTCASSAATSPPTPVRVANAPVTSRPVTASRSGAAESVSSWAPDSRGSASSSTSAIDSAPSPAVAVTVTRYCANAAGSATVNGRVCSAQRNCSPDRSSSVVHVSPSSEPSRVHADGEAVPLAPEVRVYVATVGRMPLPAHVI